MGTEVTIGTVTITHGDLTIQVGKKGDSKKQALVNVDGTTVGELVKAMNALGVTPKDMIGIIQAVYAAGAMQAELKFI